MKTLSTSFRKGAKCVKMPPKIAYTAKKRGNGRGNKRSHGRDLMRPWLESLLNEGQCQGLQWVDKPSQTFSVDWRHGSRSGFHPSEHSVFFRWVQHTGKEDKGHTANKTTFRCAAHSLKDCLDLTKEGETKGDKAKRTFQFIEPGHPQYDSKKKNRCSKKNKEEPKEETTASPSDTDEEDTWDTKHFVSDQDTRTQESQPTTEIPDTSQETIMWPFPQADSVASTSNAYTSVIFQAGETTLDATDVGLQATVMNSLSAGAERSVLNFNFDNLSQADPHKHTQLLSEKPSNEFILLKLDRNGKIMPTDNVDESQLPVFSKLGVSGTLPFAHVGLSSGGSVKVNKDEEVNSSSHHLLMKQVFLEQQHDIVAVATVPDPTSTSMVETGYGTFCNESMDVSEGVEILNFVETDSFGNGFVGLLTGLQHSPLADESSVDLESYVFAGRAENDENQVLLPDFRNSHHLPDEATEEIFSS